MAYTPIEYIESTGTQYIDTGYYAGTKTKLELLITKSDGSNRYLCGARTAWLNGNFGISYDSDYEFVYTECLESGIVYSEKDLIITEIPTITVNGVSVAGGGVSTEYDCIYPLHIFAMNNAGTAYKFASIKLYHMKIWDDGTLVLDLIPVLDENNVACLYNKATGTYLYNAGTGDFVAGNPIAKPIITIGTPSRTKISSITGYDQATVTFQSDIALQSWEARATTEGQTIGHGSGLLVESGGSLEANTDATVYVDDEELTSGDLEYTISIFGLSTNGRWSDG